jgi:hypothetical protein
MNDDNMNTQSLKNFTYEEIGHKQEGYYIVNTAKINARMELLKESKMNDSHITEQYDSGISNSNKKATLFYNDPYSTKITDDIRFGNSPSEFSEILRKYPALHKVIGYDQIGKSFIIINI